MRSLLWIVSGAAFVTLTAGCSGGETPADGESIAGAAKAGLKSSPMTPKSGKAQKVDPSTAAKPASTPSPR